MTIRASTVIIDSHLLIREALDSLIESHSYRVIFSLNSISEISEVGLPGGGPNLVIFSEPSVDEAISGAAELRKHWPACKIVWLFEQATIVDLQRLLGSSLDGCVPFCVSLDTLIHTLDAVMSGEERVMLLVVPQVSSIQPSIHPSIPAAIAGGSAVLDNKLIGSEVAAPTSSVIALASTANSGAANGVWHGQNGYNCGSASEHDAETEESQIRHIPMLSEREAQILDSLVKGHANKIIARNYDITEATVKVHIKSILRKIQVTNRTQAAIWALGHGFSADEIKSRLIRAAED